MAILYRLINYFAFYGLWCLCILTGSSSHALWVVPIILLYMSLHLLFISTSPKKEAIFIGLLTLFGAANESMLSLLGAVHYADAYWEGIAWWTLSLWACFATTYWHAFSWLASRPILASILGAFVAPICYVSIERVGELSFPLGMTESLLVIASVWAVILPCTFALGTWIQHYGENK